MEASLSKYCARVPTVAIASVRTQAIEVGRWSLLKESDYYVLVSIELQN